MTAAADTRDALLLFGAVLLGSMLVSMLPVVGVPILAIGLSALVYRGRTTLAALGAGVAVAVGGFVNPPDVVLLAPVVVVLWWVIGRARTHSPLVAIVPLTAVLMAGSIGSMAASAALAGTTFLARKKEQVDLAVETVVAAAGGVAADGTVGGADPAMLADTLFRLWPVDHFTTALISATFGMAALVWAARRMGEDVRGLPRLDVLDLSPHVLWPFIAAFALLAAARVVEDSDGIVMAAGLNLLIGTRMLLFAQGLGVVSAFYRRIGLGVLARRTGYVTLFVVDALLPIVSVLGLVDFWANFRKLPREGTPSAKEMHEGSDPT